MVTPKRLLKKTHQSNNRQPIDHVTTMASMRETIVSPIRCSVCVAEQRVPQDHPLRVIRALVDAVLREMSREFDGLYATVGRPSVPPERLLRAQLLQIFYSIRSERLLMEQLDYNLLFRWFSAWRWTSRSGARPSSPRTGTGC